MDLRIRSWHHKLAAGVAAALIASASALGFSGTASAIVGGETVHDAPSWAVALGEEGGKAMHCSGSLVASQWILTAAHCHGGDNFKVARIGSDKTNSGGTLVDIVDHIRYPGNDAALYKIETEVSNTPIELASTRPEVGSTITAFGYGQTCPVWGNCGVSNRLKTADLPVIECASGTPKVQICTEQSAEAAVCYGDSGSPALVDGRQVGVLNTVTSNCSKGYARYLDIDVVKSWVEENTED